MTIRPEIEQALVRYMWAYDAFDMDGVGACFTEDATFEVSVEGIDRTEGRDAIVGFIAGARGRRADDGQMPRHVLTNVDVEDTGADEVAARSYMILFVTEADGSARLDCTGTYLDRLVHDGKGWKIAERRLIFDRDVTAGRFPASGVVLPR